MEGDIWFEPLRKDYFQLFARDWIKANPIVPIRRISLHRYHSKWTDAFHRKDPTVRKPLYVVVFEISGLKWPEKKTSSCPGPPVLAGHTWENFLDQCDNVPGRRPHVKSPFIHSEFKRIYHQQWKMPHKPPREDFHQEWRFIAVSSDKELPDYVDCEESRWVYESCPCPTEWLNRQYLTAKEGLLLLAGLNPKEQRGIDWTPSGDHYCTLHQVESLNFKADQYLGYSLYSKEQLETEKKRVHAEAEKTHRELSGTFPDNPTIAECRDNEAYNTCKFLLEFYAECEKLLDTFITCWLDTPRSLDETKIETGYFIKWARENELHTQVPWWAQAEALGLISDGVLKSSGKNSKLKQKPPINDTENKGGRLPEPFRIALICFCTSLVESGEDDLLKPGRLNAFMIRFRRAVLDGKYHDPFIAVLIENVSQSGTVWRITMHDWKGEPLKPKTGAAVSKFLTEWRKGSKTFADMSKFLTEWRKGSNTVADVSKFLTEWRKRKKAIPA